MKKLLTLTLTALMAICACFSLTACGGIKFTKSNSQLDALTEVKAGTSDVAVIDNVMAGFYLAQDNFSDLTILTSIDFAFEQEFYSIGTRKNTNTAAYINYALYTLQQNGKLGEIAAKYGLTSALATIPEATNPGTPEAGSDFANIKAAGTLKLGYTIFEPIAFDGTDGLTGFDIDVAKEACAILGLTLTNVEINWDTKDAELNDTKSIDVIWNGLTWTEARAQTYTFTSNYMKNVQAVVIRKADVELFKDVNTLKSAKFTAESASAGEDAVNDIIAKKLFG